MEVLNCFFGLQEEPAQTVASPERELLLLELAFALTVTELPQLKRIEMLWATAGQLLDLRALIK
jgi:hypothetical protein